MDVTDDVTDATTTTLFDTTSGATGRHGDTSYTRMRFVIDILLPIIFGAGVAGNALNAVLLTRRRSSAHSDGGGGGGGGGRPTAFERSATAGLVALSASDFAFCLVGFAEVLFPRRGHSRLYYDTYHVALMNLFLFSSTWLIALVSVERCLAVCYPFRAAALIRVHRTVTAHVVVFVVSALLNVPLFLRSAIDCVVLCSNISSTVYSVTPQQITTAPVDQDDENDSPCAVIYYARPSTLSVSRPGLLYVHKVFWFAVGTFLPLLLIVYSNVRLIREIYSMRMKSSAAGGSSMSRSASKPSLGMDRDKSSTRTLTLTLIAIGVCFLLLVCPSMAIQFWKFASGEDKGRAKESAIVITNLTQAIKFSSNFLLYCVVSRSFRRTFSKLFSARCCNRTEKRSRAIQEDYNAALIAAPALPVDKNAADTGV